MKRFLPLASIAFLACQNQAVLTGVVNDHVTLSPRLMDAQGALPAAVQSVHVHLTVGKLGASGYMDMDTLMAWESKSLSLAVPVGQRYTLLIQGRNSDDPANCWRWSGQKSDSIGTTDEIVQADTLFIASLSTPSLTTAAGSYQNSIEVGAKGPQGATLRYTIDGTNPDPKSSSELKGSVILKSTGWFRVRSFRALADSSFLCSPAAEGKYAISSAALPAAPTVTPDGGTFNRTTSIVVTPPSGAKAYVSYDGKTFLAIDGDSLKVNHTGTLFLRSQASDVAGPGPVRSVSFVVDLDSLAPPASSVTQSPTFSIPGGDYRSSQQVALSCGTSGARIRYTFVTGLPQESDWIDYTSPILIEQKNTLVTLSAQAISTGRVISPITKMTYFLQP